MFDKDLPAFLFKCAQCEKHIADPEKAVGEPIAKGNGFSSMKIFCDHNCADATAVEAALLTMDGDAEEEKVDVNGDPIDSPDDETDDVEEDDDEEE